MARSFLNSPIVFIVMWSRYSCGSLYMNFHCSY
ncbi:hypothetical protein T11_9197 [Trichinella zimbabwensis]|uniref:Uncharacterized protein n=1 Tax=Trichinella zimbabwensis TaxID=268475 RepID=A0A0V1G7F6_9BILA|nr:hypothetical protein T11_9197 [Trichinella zimbabwensis]